MEAQSAERIAAVLFHGKDDEIAAAADEILRSVPEDASGRLRAYRLCALGVRNKDSALLGQAGAVLAEPIWQARILSRQAFHSCVGGRLEEAEGIYARAFPLIREHGLTRLEAVALVNLGILTEARGDPAGAIEKFRDARRLYAQIGDRAGEGLALVNSGPAYKALAAYPEAIESLVEGVELIRGSGYSRSLAGALGNLAKFYANAGVHDASIRAAHEALEVAKTHSLPTALPTAVLAESLGQAGDLVAATEASERAVELARGNGDEYTLMQTLLNLADVHRTADRLAAAEAVYEEGLRIAEHMDFLDLQLGYKLGLAYVREAQGQPETAAAIHARSWRPRRSTATRTT
ncbi:MAG: tetratricopeptide repeat protein [Planctomycetota bacterium]|jgi:tetratricopeptide (TPR) repeat protein